MQQQFAVLRLGEIVPAETEIAKRRHDRKRHDKQHQHRQLVRAVPAPAAVLTTRGQREEPVGRGVRRWRCGHGDRGRVMAVAMKHSDVVGSHIAGSRIDSERMAQMRGESLRMLRFPGAVRLSRRAPEK